MIVCAVVHAVSAIVYYIILIGAMEHACMYTRAPMHLAMGAYS